MQSEIAGQVAASPPEASRENPTRWSGGTLVAYGALAAPLGLAGIPIVMYLPAYYAKELHLSAALVGLVFLVARLWDGMSDLLGKPCTGGGEDRI